MGGYRYKSKDRSFLYGIIAPKKRTPSSRRGVAERGLGGVRRRRLIVDFIPTINIGFSGFKTREEKFEHTFQKMSGFGAGGRSGAQPARSEAKPGRFAVKENPARPKERPNRVGRGGEKRLFDRLIFK
jgi:hypothetical protein